MHRYCLKILKLAAFIVLAVAFAVQRPVFADDTSTEGWGTFELMPVRTISVKGDAAKFRATNWIDDGTTGGVKAMKYNADLGKDGHLLFEGHAITGDNDYGAKLRLTASDGGPYMTLNYGNFRKWYDTYGGFYPGFTGSSSIQKLEVDPKMDIGNFFFEVGTDSNILEVEPALSFSYERRTKKGSKSMLSWGYVQQGVRRKIAPSFENVDETTDTLTLKGNTEVAGMNLSGKQVVEFVNGQTFRVDQDLRSNTARSHYQGPQTKNLTSSLKADRWMLDDKTYVSFAYQFRHLRNDVTELIRDFNPATGLEVSSSRNRLAEAKAVRDSHSWVQHLASNLTKDLSLITKFKEEIVAASGNGDAQPNGWGGSQRSEESENRITNTGQSVSLRYAGIRGLSLYTDLDFQQTRNWLSKVRTDSSSNYENIDRGRIMTGVLGARYVLNRYFNMTSNYRYRSDHDTFNTLYTTDNGITISRLYISSNEWSNRLTWKPAQWFQASARIQLLDNVYRIQSLDQVGFTNGTNDWIKSQLNSRVFTYDVIFMPVDEWLFDVGYSMNNFKVSTPAAQTATSGSGGGQPVFTSNFHTWLASASYAPKDNLSFTTSFEYSRAKNYDSHAFTGMFYGVDNNHYDANVGIKWSPSENITLEPHYAYYSYRANQSLDYGNYSAHVGWLDCSLNW